MISWFAAFTLLNSAQSANPGVPQRIDGSVRLAKTPVLDGKMDLEEWEFLTPDGPKDASFQWEPETLYWACQTAPGQDAILSIDQNADGWLVGSDNLEVRVSFTGNEPVVQARILDASNPGQPAWRTGSVPSDQIRIAASPVAGGGFVLESSFVPIFGKGPEAGRQVGIRIDSVPAGKELSEPYLPRGMAYCFLQYDSSRDLPLGVSWKPSITNRSVALLDRVKMVFGLEKEEGTFIPTRIECRGEGAAREALATISQPAPQFDRKGRLEVNYDTVIAPGAKVGWQVIRATVKDATGTEFLVRSSVRLSNLVDFELGFPREAKASNEAQIIRGNVILRSQFSGRVEGIFTIVAPSDWSVTKGKDKTFLIYHTRGTAKIPIEFIIPRGQSGTFPMTFRAQIGTETVERRIFFGLEP